MDSLLLAISVFPFFLIALALFLLWLEGKRKPREFVRALSLGGDARKSVVHAAALFAKMFVLLIVLSFAITALGITDSENVVQVLRSQPVEMLFIAVTLAPFAEELFFRGYLQKRVGIIVSSALFASLHYSYGSIAEIIAAFFLSLLIGLEMRKNNDLNSCVLAHAAFNAFTIIIAFKLSGV